MRGGVGAGTPTRVEAVFPHASWPAACETAGHQRLGEALLFEERWEEAEPVLTRGLEAGPNDEVRSVLYLRRGNARDGAGSRPEALSDYGDVIRTDAADVLRDWATELRQAPWPDAAPEGSQPARRSTE